MADIFDETDAREQFALNASIQNARDKAIGDRPEFKTCQLCGDLTDDGAAYCSDDCLVEAKRINAIRAKQFVQRR